jgi:hypothetical protein
MTNDYDVSKFLLGNNETITANLTATGGDVALLQGMIMGRIGASQKLVPADKDAVDGSQFPVGVSIINKTVLEDETEVITLVNKGRIAEDKLNFLAVETLDTLIGPANNQRSYRDYLNDLGLVLKTGNELTNFDN